MDTTISIGSECYETGMLAGSPVGTCIECGNGVCEEIEDYCNCPEDCGGENSDFVNATAFCDEYVGSQTGLETTCLDNTTTLDICSLCQWVQ
jgi:hypothetical protein